MWVIGVAVAGVVVTLSLFVWTEKAAKVRMLLQTALLIFLFFFGVGEWWMDLMLMLVGFMFPFSLAFPSLLHPLLSLASLFTVVYYFSKNMTGNGDVTVGVERH